MDDSPQLHATSGIAYYMSPPHTIKETIINPIHMSIYIVSCSPLVRSSQKLGLKYQVLVLVMS